MNFEGIDIPSGLQAPTPDPVAAAVAAAKRAEQLVQQVRSAAERGLLTNMRAQRALAVVNRDMMVVGAFWNKVCGDMRLFTVWRHGQRQQVLRPTGTLDAVTEFSRLRNAYETIHKSFAEIEILMERVTR